MEFYLNIINDKLTSKDYKEFLKVIDIYNNAIRIDYTLDDLKEDAKEEFILALVRQGDKNVFRNIVFADDNKFLISNIDFTMFDVMFAEEFESLWFKEYTFKYQVDKDILRRYIECLKENK